MVRSRSHWVGCHSRCSCPSSSLSCLRPPPSCTSGVLRGFQSMVGSLWALPRSAPRAGGYGLSGPDLPRRAHSLILVLAGSGVVGLAPAVVCPRCWPPRSGCESHASCPACLVCACGAYIAFGLSDSRISWSTATSHWPVGMFTGAWGRLSRRAPRRVPRLCPKRLVGVAMAVVLPGGHGWVPNPSSGCLGRASTFNSLV